MTNLLAAVVADLIAITVLVYALYFRRHFRRDLVLAYIALNVGVLAVTTLLAGSDVGLGLGLGLFGILSIIRLRSDAITQEEIAYYFIALALGLVNGLHPGGVWLAPTMSALLVAVVYLVDHPRFAATTHRQNVTLDRAYPDRAGLHGALATLLQAEILHTVVLDLDLVRDVTVVDVRFRTMPKGDVVDAPFAPMTTSRYADSLSS
ncbi:DUF4956 domain-containing protein [Janibacter cremeus]|uniref:DUF4956 domain-containing protein n=1 Tax=Janibacter cremeus TaxID=1285192 RepID=A0A852VQN6_9MICO|nr:DUF4956 domain-containing protein [Janibacter cremeus]NYF98526.1 hypothetical protein [Janibacter cremeus]